MNRFLVRIITKIETPYAVHAESPQDAIERVLAGLVDKGDEDYLQLDIFVKPLES